MTETCRDDHVAHRCPHPWSTLFVTITGDVYPCCFNTTTRSFGNILQNDIRDIWFGEAFRELRRGWAGGRLAGLGCDNCRLLTMRHGRIPYPLSVKPDATGPAGANLKENFREYREGITDIRSMPVALTYFPSTLCNLSCVFCGQNVSGRHDLGETGYRLLRELTPLLGAVTWLGGEPCIQPQLARWLDELETFANPGLRLGLITNASFFPERLMERRELLAGCHINISFDAHEPELYEALRRKARFATTLANIDRYLALRDAEGRFSVHLNFLWQKRNFATLPGYLRFCRERRIRAMINPLDYWPVPMRLDLFEDPKRDLAADVEAVLEQTREEATALDAALEGDPRAEFTDLSTGMPNRTLPHVALCLDLVRAGLARFRACDAAFAGELGADYAGRLLLAHDPAGKVVGYSLLDAAGRFRLPLPSAADCLITFYRDLYGNAIEEIDAAAIVRLCRGRRVAIWGTGQAYRDHLAPLVRSGAFGDNLVCFLDNNPSTQGLTLDGRSVRAPNRLAEADLDVVVLASCASGELSAQIKAMAPPGTLCLVALRLEQPAAATDA